MGQLWGLWKVLVVPFDIEAVAPVFCKVENTFETIAVTYQLWYAWDISHKDIPWKASFKILVIFNL